MVLETDHKPLVPLLTNKPLDDLTPKMQRMRLHLMRYQFLIKHVPGKELGMADLLSRHPLPQTGEDEELGKKIAVYIRSVRSGLPASESRLQQIAEEQKKDPICKQLFEFVKNGWPAQKSISAEMAEWWQYRSDITVEKGLLLKATRIIIPENLWNDILQRIHEGHMGLVKCRDRAKQSVWWPGLSTSIADMVKRCQQCISESLVRHEPLIPTEFPGKPWMKIAMDLFYLQGKWYLLVVDYYSRYPEVALLSSLKESEIILRLKSIFARHGTPEIVFSDNETHFSPVLMSKFTAFAKEWEIKHITSSPRFPQSNGLVESAVKIVKRSLKKSEDTYKALQSYRATPLANGFSPAKLLMGCRIRSSVPVINDKLQSEVPDRLIV